MSVSKVHELLQNKGCVWLVSILMVLGVVFGSFTQCQRNQRLGDELGGGPQNAVVTVNGTDITERLFNQEDQQADAMYGDTSREPKQYVQKEIGVLRGIVGYVIQLQFAKELGVQPTDNEMEKLIKDKIQNEIDQLKQRLMMQGRLKPDATDADFLKLFEQAMGKKMADFKQEAIQKNLDAIHNSEDLRLPVAAMTIGQPMMDAFRATIKLSDEDLKKSFDTFEFKRITLLKGDVDATAKKVQQDLKSGMTFEKAIELYSEEPVPAGSKEKPSEKVEPFKRTTLEAFDSYEPLAKLKQGEVSEPITIGTSVSLFKLIRIKSEVPKDFDKKKATYLDAQLTTVTAGRLQAELQKRQSAAKFEWKDEALKWIYEFGRTMTEGLTASERKKITKQVMLESVTQSEGASPYVRAASAMALVAYKTLEEGATVAERKELEENKEKVYAAYLVHNEDAALRLDLVEMYKKKKSAVDFFDQLQTIANNNLGATNAVGQDVFGRVNKLMREGQEAKLLTAENVKELQAIQDIWKQQKQEDDAMQAKLKKEEEAATKQLEEDRKKQAKKDLETVKPRTDKGGTTPKPGGTK